MSGTVELKTNRLLLRRHQSEDAAVLFEEFGRDPKMFEYFLDETADIDVADD